MKYFYERHGQWRGEAVPLVTIAKTYGTPCYVYSQTALQEAWHSFNDPFAGYPHQINYAVKANSNLMVLNTLAQLGSGFDIVSEGELERVLAAGGQANKIVFSGVGKSVRELQRALAIGVGCINIESRAELLRLSDIARQSNLHAFIAIRINPNVSANSHPYISTGLKENKFGVPFEQAKELYLEAASLPFITLKGLAFHIGSQITSVAPFIEALDIALEFLDDLNRSGIKLSHLNVGGGLGIRYLDENPPSPQEYVRAICDRIADRNLTIHLEPGRAIAANAGVLLTRVEYLKDQFAIIDASMNDLLRPALYGAFQDIVPLIREKEDLSAKAPLSYDIVGPVCETADFLGKNRLLRLEEGDYLAVLSSGAYGFSMSSNYNSRPKAAEVMIQKDTFHLIRPREEIKDLFSSERII
jgi:diaminopimelate decarboxylase